MTRRQDFIALGLLAFLVAWLLLVMCPLNLVARLRGRRYGWI